MRVPGEFGKDRKEDHIGWVAIVRLLDEAVNAYWSNRLHGGTA